MWASKEIRKERDHARYVRNKTKEEYLSYLRDYRLKNRDIINARARIRARKHNTAIKYDALMYYSSSYSSVPMCAYPGCGITDTDMLTIDHIEDNGALHRKDVNYRNSGTIYRHLKKWKYPTGFQVLCFNHNLKKEMLRRRNGNLEVN